jgi:hypothetical protein
MLTQAMSVGEGGSFKTLTSKVFQQYEELIKKEGKEDLVILHLLYKAKKAMLCAKMGVLGCNGVISVLRL